MRLRIAARKSDLARIQAFEVGRALKNANPSLEIEYAFRASLGDINQTDPLWKMPERGVFTQDFLKDLENGECDLVVHSWKDLPVEDRLTTVIACTLKRADARDLLLIRKETWTKALAEKNLSILSSSPRRAYNLAPFLKDYLPGGISNIRFEPIRGNVQTRMRKMLEGSSNGLVVAKAAVDRLLMTTEEEFRETKEFVQKVLSLCRWVVLPLSVNPSAAAQGALAVEVKRGNKAVLDLLQPIQDRQAFEAVLQEREILAGYGGGCHQKIGVTVLPRAYGKIIFLKGETDRGEILDSSAMKSSQPFEKAESREKIWPLDPKQAVFFERDPLTIECRDSEPLWVARSDALPNHWSPRNYVWVSGLESWKKLSSRGVWVNGSAESLGEDEDPQIDKLAGNPVNWLKLTHEEGTLSKHSDTLATYRLKARSEVPDLKGKTHFYWMSGSSFKRALSLYPELRNAWHFSGPGNTLSIIKSELADSRKIRVALNYAEWMKEVV
jgi:hydroxymethylbilane synthase